MSTDRNIKRSISKSIILITCIILTIISIIVSISSSEYLFKHTLPIENFVTLTMDVKLDPDCDSSDTGLMNSEDCMIYDLFSSRASAAALREVGGKTFFLTAAHFCEIDSQSLGLPSDFIDFVTVELEIYKDNKKYPFEIEKIDSRNDLCLISSETYNINETLAFASGMPDVGSPSKVVSSPLGISEKNVNFHFSGTFSGCNGRICYYTIPAISGSSGSLILNYENKIIGITQQSLVGFPSVSIGVGIYTIIEFLEEYESQTGIRLY